MRAFEEIFEPLGLTALAIQVLTGLWMVVPEPVAGHADLAAAGPQQGPSSR
jgi:hypothetical protein